jgi:hypothetical protein
VRTQLLCTFTNESEFENLVDSILKEFELFSRKIFVLKLQPSKELVVSYNIIPNSAKFLQSTIMVHRKKESNTMYTINALNTLITAENGGVLDKSYQVDWQKYKNSIILTDGAGFKIMKTSLFRIIDVN